MTHTSACSNAKSPYCRCSCNGALHGGGRGIAGKGVRTYNRMKKLHGGLSRSFGPRNLGSIEKIVQKSIVPPLLTTTVPAAAPVFMIAATAYATYKEFQTCEKIYQHLQKSENQKALEEIVAYVSKKTMEKVIDTQSSNIAKNIRISIEQSGTLEAICEKTGLDKNICGDMIEAVISNEISEVAENMKDFVVEELIGIGDQNG